jgi:hypothetical protein
MKQIFFLLSLLSFISCKNNLQYNSNLQTIPIELGLRNDKTIFLNQISKKVEYVKLETNERCLISKPSQILVSGSNIFIVDKKMRSLLRFSRDGKFINAIGKRGKDLGDFFELGQISIKNNDSILFIQNFNKKGQILKYSFSGQFLGCINNYEGMFSRVLDNGNIIDYFVRTILYKSDFFRFIVSDTTGNILAKFMPQKRNSITDSQKSIGFNATYYNYKDSLTIWEFPSDTIFRVTPKFEVVPRLILDFGTKRMPLVLYGDRARYEIEKYNYPFLFKFIESDNYIFFTFVEHRILKYLLFDKNSGDIFNILKGQNAILNDYDGGPSFWPDGVLSDGRLYMSIDIDTIKKYFIGGNITEMSVIKTKKHEMLKRILDTSTLNDNPIIMIVTLNSHN